MVAPGSAEPRPALDSRRPAGQRVPTDAKIAVGRASVDQQALTGESDLAEKQPGDDLLGGTLNTDGELTLVVAAQQGRQVARQVGGEREAGPDLDARVDLDERLGVLGQRDAGLAQTGIPVFFVPRYEISSFCV